MLQYISNFFSQNKKIFLFVGILFSVFFLSYATGFAAGDEPVLKPEDAEKVVKFLNGFITLAAALMGMVTSFITLFLYPGWINGSLFGLEEYLKDIWILISNIVYFIFAFILIVIAFMNIIGKREGTWELKQAMPKFIVGVLIVPFSWFFVQFVLSICSVLTVGVLTLPYDSFKDKELFSQALENQQFAEEKICKDIVIAFDGDFTGQNVENISTEENGLDENIKCKEGGKLTIKELLTGKDENGNVSGKAAGLQNSIFGVISIYSYGILRIHELDTISSSQLANMKSLADLVFKIVFDILFIAVYLLLMIALLLALFVRGVRLWVFAMLSPTFGLLYFFGKGAEGIGSDKNKFSIKEFISLALVPVYVSAALAFGLVFILVASTGIQNEASPEDDTLQIGGFSLTLIGAHGDGEVEVSIIGKLIVEIFGVVILWIAVMAALGASKTTKNIIEPIQQFGNSIGELAMKAPTYAPIIPAGSGMISPEGLKQIGGSAEQYAALKGRSSGEQFMKDHGLFGNSASTNAAAADARATIEAKGADHPDSVRKVSEAIKQAGEVSSVRANKELIESLKDVAKAIGVSENKYKDISTNSSLQDVANLIGEIDYKIQSTPLKDTYGDFVADFERQGSKTTTEDLETAWKGAATPPPGDTTNNITVDSDTITISSAGGTPTNITIPSTGGFTNDAEIRLLKDSFANKGTFIDAIKDTITDANRREDLANSIFPS